MDRKKILTYIAIFVLSVLLLAILPGGTSAAWQPEVMIGVSALLYTLLVGLSCRLVGIRRPEGIGLTAIFLILFLPNSESFLSRDLDAVMELGSQCIVPFFISQYKNVSRKDFRRIYSLMLLMGIFCSYTHNGITIPLCAGFVWQGLLRRREFFHTACWPMVVGFVIGTSVSILQAVMNGTSDTPTDLHQSISQTTLALKTVWETKIFLISLGVTMYLTLSHRGRKLLLECVREQALLTSCVAFSLCTLPFAPLGLDNAMTGVCFFCMYWTLIICKTLFGKIYGPGAAAGGKEQNAVPWPLGHLAGKR